MSLEKMKEGEEERKKMTEAFLEITDPKFLVVYEFDLNKLCYIFNHSPSGPTIMKSLYSMWLELCSDIVKRRNEKSVTEVKRQRRESFYLPK